MQELLVDIEDLEELYRCYMPFIKNGGLFVRTNMRFEMGHSLALKVTLTKLVSLFSMSTNALKLWLSFISVANF